MWLLRDCPSSHFAHEVARFTGKNVLHGGKYSAMARTYIKVPYKDNTAAQALGAVWDGARRSMYIPDGVDSAPFARWLPLDLSPSGAAQAQLTLDEPATPAKRTGVPLSQLLQKVAAVVSGAFGEGVWTAVDLISVNERNGHYYLELAERTPDGSVAAKATGILWATTARRVIPAFEKATGARLAQGIKLLLRARPVFKPQFGFSIEIDAIDHEYTLGDLEARKREIRSRLQADGVFDAQRKLTTPWDYNAVLVIAPLQAAGLGDFQAESERLAKHGLCEFVYVHARFQGEGAAGEITAALKDAARKWKAERPSVPDAIVIIRGGGAANDLAWLNDYALSRLICDMRVPVLTGIGHERDSVLLDEVAHLRFDTPSKVISGIEKVIVSRAREAADNFALISHNSVMRVQKARASVDQCHAGVHADARRLLQLAKSNTEDANKTVRVGAQRAIDAARDRSKSTLDFVLERGVSHTLRVRVQLDAAFAVMRQGALQTVHEAEGRSKGLIREIMGQGPQKQLLRGFTVMRKPDGSPLTRASDAQPGDVVSVQFSDGSIQARIQDQQPALGIQASGATS